MTDHDVQRQLKKGSAEVLVLSSLEATPLHGYEIAKRIEAISGGTLSFQVASLYPVYYRMEERGWIMGRWVEKAGKRRRRYYSLTASGHEELASQRKAWQEFVAAINAVALGGASYKDCPPATQLP
jgi:PadR family transcriptional regulator PadR